jgi:DNA repair protein RecN (Recombination protein N)
MLTELVVRNLGVIEEASVLLDPGVTALTGETGAGKTLVTEAINLLKGGRAEPSLVRPGADEATVEGRFVDSAGSEFVVRRVMPAEGRSRAYLNGGLSTASVLDETIGPLIEIHGQHGQQTMLKAAMRRNALDRYGNHDLEPLALATESLRQALIDLEALGGDEISRNREMELLQYQLDEIDGAAIVDAGEDDRLAALEVALGDAGAHGEAAESAIELLSVDGPVGSALAEALAALIDREPFTSAADRLYGLQAEISDIVEELRAASGSIDDDPASLHDLQARREVLTGLRRKYGVDLASVLEFGADAQQRLDEIRNYAERAIEVVERIKTLQAAKAKAAAELLAARQVTAPKLSKKVQAELRRLALPKAQFEIQVEGEAGREIEFAISMNPGSPLLPVAKVASGGELSRVMLALQLVVGGDTDSVIYDEVDAGVGGEAALAIGQALAGVGANHQVLVVTHLPQVAACADHQINIIKTIKGKSTATELHDLDHDGRIIELARMLSGTPESDNARAHAAELLQSQAS